MRRAAIVLAIALSLVAIPAALAQSSDETNAGLEFNFGNPGARSLGLGGAFLGLADDATAAHTNPAGLVNLSRPQISIEGRGLSYTNSFPTRGHGLGEPSFIGLDKTPGIEEDQSLDRVFSPSFISIVYPRRRWAIAIFRHELANFRSSSASEGPFYGPEGKVNRLPPTRSELDLRITNYGASFAFRLAEPVTLGVTLAQQNFQLLSRTTRFPGPIFSQPDFAKPNSMVTQHGEGRGTALHAGLQVDLTRQLRFGAAFRKQSDHRVNVRTSSLLDGEKRTDAARFHVPDVYSIGFGWRPGYDFRTTISFDVNHIRYSQLTNGFTAINGEPNLYEVPDGQEYRLGVERIVQLRNHVVAVRAGAWRDPDHRIRYGDLTHRQSLLFNAGDAEYHFTTGLGFVLDDRFQVDGAYDYSRRQRSFAISLVTNF